MIGDFAFVEAPTLGFTVEHNGHTYVVLSVRPYCRRDGKPSGVIRWRSACWCLEPFEFETGLAGRLDRIRCDKHVTQRRKLIAHLRYHRGWEGRARGARRPKGAGDTPEP